MNTRLLVAVFLFLQLIMIGVHCQCSEEQTALNEQSDYKTRTKFCCYYDSLSIPTIGIGYNLKNSDARETMKAYGLDLDNVLDDCDRPETNRTSCLDRTQAWNLFDTKSYPNAVDCVTDWVGTSHPKSALAALYDMAFMGCSKLQGFVKLKAALDQQNYKAAAAEVVDSLWCEQVKEGRCYKDRDCVANARGCFHCFYDGCTANNTCRDISDCQSDGGYCCKEGWYGFRDDLLFCDSQCLSTGCFYGGCRPVSGTCHDYSDCGNDEGYCCKEGWFGFHDNLLQCDKLCLSTHCFHGGCRPVSGTCHDYSDCGNDEGYCCKEGWFGFRDKLLQCDMQCLSTHCLYEGCRPVSGVCHDHNDCGKNPGAYCCKEGWFGYADGKLLCNQPCLQCPHGCTVFGVCFA
eukprot:TRINITY_DN44_c0_g1_i1.p1 TRINITY_DN44_c0_g1~~TRINITY_DN44_c0_g1_i1.p1  ORF type:complete len:402 (-),score=41.66 TRINITY_DN44_c0_g1_i1:164-1369(-)